MKVVHNCIIQMKSKAFKPSLFRYGQFQAFALISRKQTYKFIRLLRITSWRIPLNDIYAELKTLCTRYPLLFDNFLLAVKERHFSSSAALLNLIKSTEEISLGEQTDLNTMIQEYKSYKKSFVRNMKYDPNSYHLGKYILSLHNVVEYPTLQGVHYSCDDLFS